MMWWAEPWLIFSSSATWLIVTCQFSCIICSTSHLVSDVFIMWSQPGYISYIWYPALKLSVATQLPAEASYMFPHCLFILWWISADFSPSLPRKLITACCSSLVHASKRPAILDLVCWCHNFKMVNWLLAYVFKEERHNISVLHFSAD